MATTAQAIEDAVANYLAAWNEPDGERRVGLLARAVSDNIHIAIGEREIIGRAALQTDISEFHRAMPGARGRFSTKIDVQGNVCRFSAVVEAANGSVIAEMFDACQCDTTGLICRIITFTGA